LDWEAPASSGNSPIFAYRVYRGLGSGTETFLAAVGNMRTFQDANAAEGAMRWYRVRAVNGVGEGPTSNEASASWTKTTVGPPSSGQSSIASLGVPIGVTAAIAIGVIFTAEVLLRRARKGPGGGAR
jgi:hypothetical protein